MRLPGFTLIELVIYMAILGILGAGVFSAYTFFLRHQIKTRQIAELRSASDDLSRHFHEYFGGADRITLVGRGHQICAIATHHEFLERTGLTLTSGEKVTAHSFGGVSGSTSRSLSFWILAPDQASPQTIIDFGTDQPGRRWQVMTDADGRVLLNISGTSIRGHTSLRDGNWHHVMLVFDAARDAHLTSANLNIYVDGETETLTQAPGHPIIADTDISAPMSLGGSASDSSFIGTLAAVKLWEKALDPAAIWPELLSSTAIDRNGLALELQLTANLDDTSGRNHSMNGPSSLTFAAKHRSYSKKTVFSFLPNPARAPFYLLWQKRYMSGIREPSSDRCETPDETRGWSLSADHHWHLKQEAPFHLENGILEIRAEIADQVAGRITSVSSDTRIITHSGDSPDILCRISPGITGFDTGDEPMAKAVIRIDPDHFEADGDMLFFAANISSRQGPLRRVAGGQTVTYQSYKNISASGRHIWGDITAEYAPSSGTMTICTTTAAHCSNANMQSKHALDAWAEVFRQVRYTSNRMTHHPRKRFIFTLTNGSLPGPNDILSLETVISPGEFFTFCP